MYSQWLNSPDADVVHSNKHSWHPNRALKYISLIYQDPVSIRSTASFQADLLEMFGDGNWSLTMAS